MSELQKIKDDIKAIFDKYFGHILEGRNDTAEYGRIVGAHGEIEVRLTQEPFTPANINDLLAKLPVEAPIADNENPDIGIAPVIVTQAQIDVQAPEISVETLVNNGENIVS